jgi:hypothetical protein
MHFVIYVIVMEVDKIATRGIFEALSKSVGATDAQ